MHVGEIQAGTEGALATIAGSAAGTGAGMALGGIAAVLVISAVFYAVGRGEDRDRARATRDGDHDDQLDGEPAAKRAPRPPSPTSARRRRRR
jgi:hypothetical protein